MYNCIRNDGRARNDGWQRQLPPAHIATKSTEINGNRGQQRRLPPNNPKNPNIA
ncbi:MAG: hypothetical protein LBD35_00830 [Prevotellaceae bacterium]|nr:hypothetical protein [Prevotellaceae bacterium]